MVTKDKQRWGQKNEMSRGQTQASITIVPGCFPIKQTELIEPNFQLATGLKKSSATWFV